MSIPDHPLSIQFMSRHVPDDLKSHLKSLKDPFLGHPKKPVFSVFALLRPYTVEILRFQMCVFTSSYGWSIDMKTIFVGHLQH